MCCNGCVSDIFLVCLSVLFPPLPVWIRRGFCTTDSLINVLLFCLGYFPGLIHLWYIIAKYPPYEETRVYYVYRSDLENQLPREARHRQHHNPEHGVIVYTNEPRPQPQPPYLMGSHHQLTEGELAPAPHQPLQGTSSLAAQNYGSMSDQPPSYEHAGGSSDMPKN